MRWRRLVRRVEAFRDGALAPKQALRNAVAEAYAELAASPPADVAAQAQVQARAVSVASSADERDHPHVNELLEVLLDRNGSDLHITAGSPPQVRIHGALQPLDEFGIMKPAALRSMIYEVLTSDDFVRF